MPASPPIHRFGLRVVFEARSRFACCLAILWLLCIWSSCTLPTAFAAEPEFKASEIEFFEKEVRPILVRRCYECHSANSKKLQGGLRVDSRAALLEGGDTGPAIVPHKPKESLLVDAINYGELYEMPPKSKMPAKEINTLTRWIAAGAAWPKEAVAKGSRNEFDLQERMKHWAWRSIAAPSRPQLKDKNWALDPLDEFILAKLEQAGIQPAGDADKRTLIRRVYFDLIGLPPTTAQVEAFVADNSAEAYQNVVKGLLDSPQFGERWARHWLDLVRYAESRGHEFDYSTPNAFRYRDYVIRALNNDLPYDEFVVEHIAGDLLEKPRVHPQSGYNESVQATGFWFLGEWCHSPVDIRKDETDRFDNMVDVFSKTFLGLTVACARCHDHKFDAISQTDYYALFGYLQSSAYRQVRFESMAHNQRIAAQAARVRATLGPKVIESALRIPDSDWRAMKKHLAAAVKVIRSRSTKALAAEVIFEDFEDGTFDRWTAKGEAFSGVPQDAASIAPYQGKINAKGKFFLNSHNIRSSIDKSAQHSDRFTGRLISKPFELSHNSISMLVGGGAHPGTCVNLLVKGRPVRTAHGRNQNKMFEVTWSVGEWLGQQVQIEVVDEVQGGWGNIGLDQIVLRNQPSAIDSDLLNRADDLAEQLGLSSNRLQTWCRELVAAADDAQHPLRVLASSIGKSSQLSAEQKTLAAQLSGEDEQQDWQVIADYRQPKTTPLLQDGVTFGVEPVRAGQVWVDGKQVSINEHGSVRRSPLFRDLSLAPGAQKEAGRLAKYDRAGKALRTATFVLKPERLFYLVRGRGLAYAVVDSHRMINGPLHGALIREFDTKGQYQWIEHNLSRYAKHDAHVELIALGKDSLDVALVVQAPQQPAFKFANFDDLDLRLAEVALLGEQEKTIEATLDALRTSTSSMLAGSSSARDVARSNWLLIRHRLLSKEHADSVESAKNELVERMGSLAKQVRQQSQTAPAIWDGTAYDEKLLIRGNNKTPGNVVKRRLLSALGGKTPSDQGSGRLEMARELVSDANPFPARVMVNRIWHHLTGRGIAAEPDNFGVLGQEPTHPELLDHLADRFRRNGWSLKKMISTIVLSRTYRMASTPSAAAAEFDPNNELLHRMRIRRLQAESIRDAVLSISGRLDETMYGPSVPVYLTPFMQGRGRPRGGPLDGSGRRSVYISVRRNFLSPLMLTFDAPQPFSTMGRRTSSNVPAQALILMNDPFIVEQAKLWAQRLLSDPSATSASRIERAYAQAFARQPTALELEAAKEFLQQQAKDLNIDADQVSANEQLWAEFCHVLINLKEFIFIR